MHSERGTQIRMLLRDGQILNVGGPAGTPPQERRLRVDAAVDRLVGEGATQLRTLEEYGEYCVVMQDPEGNEFCLQ